MSDYSKEYYQRNKDKWKVYNEPEKHRRKARAHYHRNKERLNIKKRQWDEDNYEWVLWAQTKRRAKYDDIYWDLVLEDIIIPEKCPLLEVPLTRTQGQGMVWTNASVDRVDNSKGYTKDNIQIVSRLANSMKSHASVTELITFAKNILRMFND